MITIYIYIYTCIILSLVGDLEGARREDPRQVSRAPRAAGIILIVIMIIIIIMIMIIMISLC